MWLIVPHIWSWTSLEAPLAAPMSLLFIFKFAGGGWSCSTGRLMAFNVVQFITATQQWAWSWHRAWHRQCGRHFNEQSRRLCDGHVIVSCHPHKRSGRSAFRPTDPSVDHFHENGQQRTRSRRVLGSSKFIPFLCRIGEMCEPINLNSMKTP